MGTNRPVGIAPTLETADSILEDRNARRVEILGVPVAPFTPSSLLAALTECIKTGKRGWFGSVNVHAINLSQNDSELREFFRRSLTTYCDGEGVRLGAWLSGGSLPPRIALTDWIYFLCEFAEREQLGIFFLGATPEVIAKATDSIRTTYRRIRISGFHDGHFPQEESNRITELIRSSGADILVVGMGMPLQEKWILEHFNETGVRIAFDAGAVFDFVASAKPRCPKWMGDHGMEWIFRLAIEPRRLWRRYLIGNPLFVFRVVRNRFVR